MAISVVFALTEVLLGLAEVVGGTAAICDRSKVRQILTALQHDIDLLKLQFRANY